MGGPAVREVREETGCEARIVSFAGVVHYVPDRTPKVVLFWNMELVSEGPLHFPEEVDEIAWLTAPEALRRLDHDTERGLLLEALQLRQFEPRAETLTAPSPRPGRRLLAPGARRRRSARRRGHPRGLARSGRRRPHRAWRRCARRARRGGCDRPFPPPERLSGPPSGHPPPC